MVSAEVRRSLRVWLHSKQDPVVVSLRAWVYSAQNSCGDIQSCAGAWALKPGGRGGVLLAPEPKSTQSHGYFQHHSTSPASLSLQIQALRFTAVGSSLLCRHTLRVFYSTCGRYRQVLQKAQLAETVLGFECSGAAKSYKFAVSYVN